MTNQVHAFAQIESNVLSSPLASWEASRLTPPRDDGKPALEEATLRPGKSITFDAVMNKAVAVGVRLWMEGEEQLLWCEL
jgi:hypothetical protein